MSHIKVMRMGESQSLFVVGNFLSLSFQHLLAIFFPCSTPDASELLLISWFIWICYNYSLRTLPYLLYSLFTLVWIGWWVWKLFPTVCFVFTHREIYFKPIVRTLHCRISKIYWIIASSMPTQGKILKAYKHIHRDTHTHTQNSCSHCRNSVKNAVTGWSHKPGSSLFSGAIAWNELLPPLPSPKPFQCYGGQNPCSSVLPCWLVVTVRHTEQSASRLDDFLPPFSTHRHVHFVFPIFHTPTTTLSSKVAAKISTMQVGNSPVD